MTTLPNLPDIFKDLVSCINIDTTLKKCDKKCKFTYYFNESGILAKNMGSHILMEFDDASTTSPDASAEYSSPNTTLCGIGGFGKLAVKEMRLYVPSRHSYKNELADGELLILLNNIEGGRNLIVSIPIAKSHGTIPYASSILSEVVSFLGRVGNSEGQGGMVTGMSVQLNKFIPKNTGYYSYVGHPPWITEKAANKWKTNGQTSFATIFDDTIPTCHDIIVYDIKDAAINLNIQTMAAIETILPWSITNVLTRRSSEFIITDLVIHYNRYGDLPNVFKANAKKFDNEITPLEKSKLAYNRKGAIYSKNDNIWIDCAPTGSEGDNLVVYEKPTASPSEVFSQYYNIAFLIFLTILSTYILYNLYKHGHKLVGGKAPAAVVAAVAAVPQKP